MSEYTGITHEARGQLFSFIESDASGWEVTSSRFRNGAWASALKFVAEEARLPSLKVIYENASQDGKPKVYIIHLDRLEAARDDS